MGLFGVDVSNHQKSFDFFGWDFAFIKASEGVTFKDGMFHTHLANARRARCVVAAYHYQRPDPAAEQVATIESMVPKDVPIIIDVEDGSGTVDLTREIIAGLRERGYRVGPVYIPRWWWKGVGRPSLHGLPALWASWYPDYTARPREDGLAKVPSTEWGPYGDNPNPVAIMQFTSTPFDQNYFPGTREQLNQLLDSYNGKAVDMPLTPDDGNVLWASADPFVGSTETHKVADWLGLGTFYGLYANQKLDQVIDRLTAIEDRLTAFEGADDVDAVAEKAKQKVVEDLND